MGKRDWRNQAEKAEGVLENGVWYRTPLSEKDHLLGQPMEFVQDGLSWCGYALGYVQAWRNDEYGGLWFSNRNSRDARCAECRRKEEEYVGVK